MRHQPGRARLRARVDAPELVTEGVCHRRRASPRGRALLGRAVRAQHLRLDTDRRMLIITGPNGREVDLLRQAALIAVLAHVAATCPRARLLVRSLVFYGIGGG